MKNIGLIFRHEFITTFRRRSFIIVGFGFPLFAILLFAAIRAIRSAAPQDPSETVEAQTTLEVEGFVDQSGLVSEIPEDLPAGTLLKFADESQAAEALQIGEIAAYYVVPDDYVQSGEIFYVHPAANPINEQGQSWIMRWTLLVNLLKGDSELASRVWNPHELSVQRRGSSAAADRFSDEDCSRPGPTCRSSAIIRMIPMSMIVFFFMTLMAGSGMLLRNISTEKQNHTMETLMLSISPRQMLAGKMLGLGLASLIQSTFLIGAIWIILRIGTGPLDLPPEFNIPSSLIFWWLIYFLLGYAIYASLMAGLGALVPDIKAGTQATILVIFPLFAAYAISVMPFSMENTNGSLMTALSIIPFTSPISMIMRLTAGVVPFWQLMLSIGLLLATSPLVIRSVGKVFQAQMILSGQPFSVRRYYRALLGNSS
jgi:ABC-2 type transport system permease protein